MCLNLLGIYGSKKEGLRIACAPSYTALAP